MRERIVFEKSHSLYINIPRDVISDSGIKKGDRVHVRYVGGIGVIVSLPIKIPYVDRKVNRLVKASLDEISRSSLSFDGKSYDVIPLFDTRGLNKQ